MNSLIWVRFWELSQNVFGILQRNLLFNFAKMEKTAWECNESHRKWGKVHQEKKICKHSWACLGWQLCQSVPSSTEKVEIKGSGFTDPCVCGIPIKDSVTHICTKVCCLCTVPSTKCCFRFFYCVLCLADWKICVIYGICQKYTNEDPVLNIKFCDVYNTTLPWAWSFIVYDNAFAFGKKQLFTLQVAISWLADFLKFSYFLL